MWPFKRKNLTEESKLFSNEVLFALMIYKKHGASTNKLLKAINFDRTLAKIEKRRSSSLRVSELQIREYLDLFITYGWVEKGEVHDNRQFWIITELGKQQFETLRREKLEPTS